MSINLKPKSALNLPLEGSAGVFKVGRDKTNSLEVKYFLTHVSLNFDVGSDEKLLKELAPVREIFDFKQLDFDEIMQRDIDDARVSSELIPYILDEQSKDLIKFFPPIVVVVLPVENDRNKPAAYYPKVEIVDDKLNEAGVEDWRITRAGSVGAEVFQFKQPVLQGVVDNHRLVEFSLNTSKCRLVIVDGQHRAMALLALYRNLKDQWADANRKPFESYYREWTPDYIRRFELNGINLPLIICTIPSLCEGYEGDYDLKKASRSIFLTLNKNARKVSRSRNLLLDDNDLISSFMRSTLSHIKNGDRNIRASNSLEIHNVELDQTGDKQKINSPVAITGVSHLYYMIEHMLLDSGDIKGVSPRSGRFSTRVANQYFSNALDRLNCIDILGMESSTSIRRDVYSSEDDRLLTLNFDEIYGRKIIQALAEFFPYDAHNSAAIALKELLSRHSDVHLKPMLFDGQGMSKVFEKHRESLALKIKENYFEKRVPKIESIKEELDNTSERLKIAIEEFQVKRASNYFDGMPKIEIFDENKKIKEEIVKFTNQMFENIFSTVAFQSALICGFFTEIEKYSSAFAGQIEIDIDETYEEYLFQIGECFRPKSLSKYKVLLSLFSGKTTGDSIDSLRILSDSPETFRNVVFPSEMQPDQWPKYKYLLLEMWRPTNKNLLEKLDFERRTCRKEIYDALHARVKKTYLSERRLVEDELNTNQKLEIFNKSFEIFKDFLSQLGRASEISETQFKKSEHTDNLEKNI